MLLVWTLPFHAVVAVDSALLTAVSAGADLNLLLVRALPFLIAVRAIATSLRLGRTDTLCPRTGVDAALFFYRQSGRCSFSCYSMWVGRFITLLVGTRFFTSIAGAPKH